MRKLVFAGALVAVALALSCSGVTSGSFPQQVVVIGFDGLDPQLASRWMREGRLPNLAKLSTAGGFYELQTTVTPGGAAAWASFATGVNPGKHNVFASTRREPATYNASVPLVTREPSRLLFNFARITSEKWTSVRAGTSFWTTAGESGARTSVIGVPLTFPPEDVSNGELLSGMPLPDIRGTSGTFHYFGTAIASEDEARSPTGGIVRRLAFQQRVARAELTGPRHPVTGTDISLPLTITWNHEARSANVEFSGNAVHLREREWSRWLPVAFPITAIAQTRGLVQLFLVRAGTHFALYVSPVNWHPESPPAPISSPRSFAAELFERLGPYRTLDGSAVAAALDEELLDEDAFLDDVDRAFEDRAETILNRLDADDWDLVVGVVDAPDRVQHVMWRLIDPQHPRYEPELARRYSSSIEQIYKQADELVGELLERVRDNAIVMIVSDHGFGPFRATVNLNAWLAQRGYLSAAGSQVDWSRTRAFATASGHVYVNLQGRDPTGIVAPGEQYDALIAELQRELTNMVDPGSAARVVKRVMKRDDIFHGPFAAAAPDLVVALATGYRALDVSTPVVTPAIVEPNLRKWSGDHVSAEPADVAGVLITNARLGNGAPPRIIDVAPTVLQLLGIAAPADYDGRSLLATPD